MQCPAHKVTMSLISIACSEKSQAEPFLENGYFQARGSTGFSSYSGVRYKEALVSDNDYTYICPHGCSFTTKAIPSV